MPMTEEVAETGDVTKRGGSDCLELTTFDEGVDVLGQRHGCYRDICQMINEVGPCRRGNKEGTCLVSGLKLCWGKLRGRET